MPIEEVRLDSFRLEDGGVSLRLTHVPTGIAVDDGPCHVPYLDRLTTLHSKLEQTVQEFLKQTQHE